MSSRRQRKQAAVARFKAARLSGRSSALDDWHDGTDDAVYDEVPEDEYRALVESRRDREDFVVDDEGLGYHDDGEETFGHDNDDDDEQGKRRQQQQQRHGTASLTQAALRKARKAKQAHATAAAAVLSTENTTSSTTSTLRNTSMWDFVNPAAAASSSLSSSSRSNAMSSSSRPPRRVVPNVEDLLATLDEERVPTSCRHGRRPKRKSCTTSRGGSSRYRRRTNDSYHDNDDKDDDDQPMTMHHDEDNDNDDQPMMHDDDDNDDDNDDDENNVPKENACKDDGMEQGVDNDNSSSPSPKQVRFEDDNHEDQKAAPKQDQDSSDNEQTQRRRRRRRVSQLDKVSGPAKQAMEKQAAVAAKVTEIAKANTATNTTTTTNTTLPTLHMPPTVHIPVAETSTGTAGQVQLSDFMVTNDNDDKNDQGGGYLDFYWMDLCERQGQVILFGKVQRRDGKGYISASVVVENCLRNLFCLPKPGADMMDVHQEVAQVLQKHVLPRQAGTSWKGKVVQRSYAFDDAALPRSATDYLKICYDAKLDTPPAEICERGGQHFARILNHGASLTETFILKRKLMGPCWIRLQAPVPCKAPLTWTRLEVRVASPKQVTRLDLVEGAVVHPTPVVSTMTVQFKTVVHPTTHQAEIVSLTALLHTHVPLEAGTPSEHAQYARQLSLVRPLPHSAADGPQPLPRDWESKSVQKMPNERALLSRFLAQVHTWDADVWMGHNALGYGLPVLLQRCVALKLKNWSQVGRRRQTNMPKNIKDWAVAQAMTGRLLCDTYLSAKELLRETTYSLTALAASQLQSPRPEMESVDLPLYFSTAAGVHQVCQSTMLDAQLVQKLAFKLQTLPLTKQLTNIAGNLWSHTLKSNRAERTEYLLLHEFHRLKYLPPEKRSRSHNAETTTKAKYAGGLVLEPKKGLYDSFILLLDFNSLYPSLIQEYNLCFTTLEWANYVHNKDDNDKGDEDEQEPNGGADEMPLPDPEKERGVLPRVIQSLVEARRNVKRILKSEQNPAKKQELNIRQQALKLTANSMYGCLGFSNSRFFAQPIAAKVTQLGRETLQKTVDIAQNTVGLDVIYGDTDSIMINTRLNQDEDLSKVTALGESVKREVNKLYRTLELEIDGIFRSMLLLKKKKYAAKTVEEQKDGKVVKYGQELKGLDLVRRDWCVQSKDTGRYVTEQILSGQENEIVVHNIHSHLEELAKKMRDGELALEKYVITKGLSKHPKDYPDGKSLPHVQVAKQMLQNNRPVNTGDHIPYIITSIVPPEGPLPEGYKPPSATERARHPEEITRSNGVLTPDVEWYLTQQILPPIARLCEPIEGTSQQELASRLGLDSTRYSNGSRSEADLDADQDIDYKPASSLSDEERFKDVEKLHLFCLSCHTENEFPGVFRVNRDGTVVSGMFCPNEDCPRPAFWGHRNQFDCYSRIVNSMSIWCHGLASRYYQGTLRCDEPCCSLETRQLSVVGAVCLRSGCPGTLQPSTTERTVHTHLKYLERLVCIDHAAEQMASNGKYGTADALAKQLTKSEKAAFDGFHKIATKSLESSAYNWITPMFWRNLFRLGNKQ